MRRLLLLSVVVAFAIPAFSGGRVARSFATDSRSHSQQAATFEGPTRGEGKPGSLLSFSEAALRLPLSIDESVMEEIPEGESPRHPDPDWLPSASAPHGSNEVEDRSSSGTSVLSTRSSSAPDIFASFQGLQATGRVPPDPIVAAGPGYQVAAVNSSFAIFSKSGTSGPPQSATTWFRDVLPSIGTGNLSPAFDPRVLYDHFSNRWLMVYLSTDKTSQSWILLSISDGVDPTGLWCNYALQGDLKGSTPSGNWSDFDGVGFDSDLHNYESIQVQHFLEGV